MRRFLRYLLATLALAALSTPGDGQGTRASAALGATWLDFGSDWGGDFAALTAQARLSRTLYGILSGEVSVLAVLPIGGAAVIPDCVPGARCFERSTPDALLGALGSFSIPFGTSGWRGTAGAGGLKALNMKGPGRHSSALGSIGLDWMAARPGLTPTIGVRVIGLASSVAGVRYVVLPAIGIVF